MNKKRGFTFAAFLLLSMGVVHADSLDTLAQF